MKIPLRKQFGNNVKALRLASGLSQEAFADKCGFARSYMSRIERGAANPSLDAISTLATGLGVNVATLFNNTGKPKAKDRVPAVVPFSKDGSFFNPGLRRPRSEKYTVGLKGKEISFDKFEEALSYLKSMKLASWRRPNAVGNWGRVVAVKWAEIP